ncbi:MAG: cadherin-like beta sandwich domain-containing protein [Acholeplasmatales bacterium]|nr:cadherin-like beta sandwich domain-containing protein [Acholeplasmatales bacterium]
MNKFKRFLIVTAAFIAAVATAISVGIATNKAQAAPHTSTDTYVEFDYEVYTQANWDKKQEFLASLLTYLEWSDEFQGYQTEKKQSAKPSSITGVTIDLAALEATYWDDGLDGITDAAGTMSAKAYFGKKLTELVGTSTITVDLTYVKTGGVGANTKWMPSSIEFDTTSLNYDFSSFQLSEAPSAGDNLVLSVTATSDVDVNAIHISIDQTKLGVAAGTIGNSDFIDNGVADAGVDSSDTANIYNNDGGDTNCFTMGWANKSTSNSIPAGSTIPVGAVAFTVGSLPSTGFTVSYTPTASTNFRTGSSSYTSNVASTHFGEDDITFSASSALLYKVLDGVTFTATATTSPVVNFTFVQGSNDSNTIAGDVEIGSDTTALSMKVNFQTSKVTSVTVGGSTISDGQTVSVGHAAGTKITIIVTDKNSPAGTKAYEYTVKHISSDTSLSISVAGSSEGDSAGTPTIDATNKITFPDAVKFKNTGYVITANPTASGAKVYKGNASSTTLLTSSNNTINFTDNSYLAVTHSTQQITVEAPSGVKTTYTLVVKRAQASTDTSLSALDITVNGSGGTKINSGATDTLTSGTSGSKLVYLTTNSIFVSATPTDTTNAKIYFDSSSTSATYKSYSSWTSAGTVTINFEVRSEAYAKDTSQKATHSITVYREIASSASSFSYTLKNSSGIATETPVNSTPSTDKYKVDATNFNDNKFQIIVTGYDKDKSKVYVHNNSSVGTFVSPNGTDITATGVYTLGAIGTDIYVTCFAEDNSSKTTKLIQTEIKSTDSSLTNVQLSWSGPAGNNSETIAESAFTATGVANEKVATMTKTIPYSHSGSKVGTVTVIANGHATGQTITYDGTTSQTVSITDNGTNAVSQVVVIKVVSKDDSTAFTEYKLTINRAAPQTDVRLKELKFEDQSGNSLGTWNQTTQTFTPGTTADLERTVASITCTAEFINDNVSLYDGATTAFSNTATRTYTRQQTFTNTTAVGSITFNLIAKDEAGNPHNILVATFTRKAANDDISLNPTTSYLEYLDNDGNPHTIALDTTSFTIDSTYTNYTMKSGITIPYGVTSVTSLLYPNATTGAKPTKLNFTSSSTAYASVVDETGVAHPNPVTKSVIASSPTFHVFAYTELRNNVQVNIKVNIAAAKNDNAFTWDLINNSGVAETKPTPTGSEYNFNNLEETDYPTNKFTLNIALVNPANGGTIYVTTDDSNDAKIKGVSDANKYDPTKTYDIGVGKVYYIVCYAENNTTNKVTVKATFKGQNNNKMKNVLVWDETGSTPVAIPFTFNPATPTQADIIVPFSVKKVRLEAVPDASTATVVNSTMEQAFPLTNTGTPTSTPAGSPNVKKIQLQSETKVAGTEYTFNIYREDAVHDQYMETATINSTINLYSPNNTNVYDTYTKLDNVINVRLPRAASNTAVLDFTVSQKAKTFNVIGATNNGSNYSVTLTNGGVATVKVQVQSEYNASESPSSYNEYTINIYKADDSVTIGSFALYDQNGNEAEEPTATGTKVIYTYSSTDSYPKTITVPYSQTHGEMRLTLPTGSYVQHSGDGVLKQLTAGSTTPITVTVESEFHKLCADAPVTQQVDYIFNIKRTEGKDINTLKEITITIPDGNGTGVAKTQTWKPDIDGDGTDDVASTTFQISDVDGNANIATISYVKADDTEKVTGDVGTKVLTLSPDPTVNASHTYHIVVTSEKGTEHTYDIIVSKQVITLSSEAKLANVVVTASDGKTYLSSTLPSNTFMPLNETYSVLLPATSTSYSVVFTKIDANTKVYADLTRLTEITGNSVTDTISAGNGTIVYLSTTSQDGQNHMNYVVTINVEQLDPNRFLDDLRVDGSTVAGFDKDKKDYEVNVVNTVEHVTIEAFAQSTNATITYQDASGNVITDPTTAPGVELVEGDNKFDVICKAQSGASYVYKLNIVRDHKSTMTSVVIHTGDPTNPIAEYTPGTNTLDPTDPASPGVVDYTVKEITVSGIPTGGNDVKVEVVVTDPEGNKTTKTLPQDGTDVKIPIEPGTSSVNIVVTPESGTPTSYPVNITRKPGSQENYILTYEHAGTDITPDLSKTKFTYDYIVPRNTATFNPTLTVSDNATYELPAQKAMHVGLNSFDVVVKAQTGDPQTYTFNVYAAETEKDVLSVYGKETDAASAEIVDIDGTTKIAFPGDGNTSTINVDNSVSQVFLEINPKGSYAKVKVDGVDFVNSLKPVTEGTNTFNVEVISEYATYNPSAADTKTTFKIVVIRGEKDKEKRLDSLVISWAGGDPVIWDATQDDADNTDTDVTHIINVENVGSATSVNIAATQTKSGGATLSTMSGTGVKSLTTSAADYSINTQVIVTSQFGKKNIYDITITRGPANANDDNEIIDILVTDADGNTYIGEGKFDPETQEYNVNIPYTKTNQSYTISVKTNEGSPAIVTGAGQTQIVHPNYSKTHDVYATSKSGQKGTVYKVNVTAESPSNENRLASLTVDGVMVPGFEEDKLNYIISAVQPYTKTSVKIGATAKDPLATITGALGDQILEVGPNLYQVNVTAQDGTPKNYTITITRDSEAPVLANIDTDTNLVIKTPEGVETQFAGKVYEYLFASVASDVSEITLKALTTSADHTVTCSPSKSSLTPSVKDSGKEYGFRVSLPNTGDTLNEFILTVTDTNAKSTKYTVRIRRMDETAKSTELTLLTFKEHETGEYTKDILDNKIGNNLDLKQDVYDGLLTQYVDNKVRNLDVNYDVLVGKTTYHDGTTVDVYNNTDLKVGDNYVVVKVTSPNGEVTRTILAHVVRAENEFDAVIDEIPTFKSDFADSDIKAKYTVPADVTSLTYSVTNHDKTDTAQPTVKFTNADNLQVGENKVNLVITAADGTTEMHEFIVVREASDLSIKINEISEFNTDYANDDVKQTYKVPSTVGKLSIEVTDPDTKEKLSFIAKNAENLQVGENQVTLVATKSDGTTEELSVTVVREKIKYEVDKTAYSYDVTEQSGKYSVKLDTAKPTEVTDWKKYIKFDADQKLNVELLSDVDENTTEVLLKVSSEDGVDSEIVTLNLDRTYPKQTNNAFDFTDSSNLLMWIILLIAIVLLVIILISVNRDKYGRVNKNRKKE